MKKNPARGVEIPPQPLMAPRQLSPDQRYVLRSLIERNGQERSAALFALGYWAGARVSDVSWLQMEHTHIGPKVGWLHIGFKDGKTRDIIAMLMEGSLIRRQSSHKKRFEEKA